MELNKEYSSRYESKYQITKENSNRGKTGTENLGCQAKPLEVSLTNRTQEMEERTSGIEGKVEKMDTPIKENAKLKQN